MEEPPYETSTSALLRSRIQEILKGRKSNLILSTPPPPPEPTFSLGGEEMNCLSLSKIEKLDVESLEFTPLSTPPNGEMLEEEGWGLILVTGQYFLIF